MGEVGELVAFAVAVWLLWCLVRLPGRTRRTSHRMRMALRGREPVQVRVPWRWRYPRLWWGLVAVVLVVVVPVFALPSACGWWGL